MYPVCNGMVIHLISSSVLYFQRQQQGRPAAHQVDRNSFLLPTPGSRHSRWFGRTDRLGCYAVHQRKSERLADNLIAAANLKEQARGSDLSVVGVQRILDSPLALYVACWAYRSDSSISRVAARLFDRRHLLFVPGSNP